MKKNSQTDIPELILEYNTSRIVFAEEEEEEEEAHVVVSLKDITERKQAEEALRESLARLARAEAFSHIMVTHIALDGRWLKVPPTLCSLLGYSEPELLASTLQEVMHPEDRAGDWDQYQRLLQSDLKSFSSTKRCRRKDGQVVWFDVNCTLVTDREGQPVHFLTYLRDVTQNRQSEERVREQARLLDLAQDAIVVRDLEDRITFWNQGAERLYGWTAAEAIGRNAVELLCCDEACSATARKVSLEKGEWNGELPQRTRGGQEIIVHSRWTLVREAQGNRKSILTVSTDLTEKKKLEAQFLRAQRLESIGALASGIAHDLNNILAPIIMCVPLVREELPPGEAADLLSIMETSARRGVDVVKQLLAFGRGLPGERRLVQPKHLIKEMVKMARETFPKAIAVSFSVPADLWTVLSDATQLQQVLLNLCVNARDAMPDGGTLTLTAKNVRLAEQEVRTNPEAKVGPYVLLQVSDTGHGMLPEMLDKIFDPFFTTKAEGKGTGLGLSTVLGIVKSHGGFVRVDSRVGQGSTFEVYLPAVLGGDAVPGAPTPAALPRSQGELILVVDDEATIRDITRRTLEKLGYVVVTASDGSEALSLYAQRRRDIKLVLTDLMMPRMDGLALTQLLKQLNPQVKIIAASGLGEEAKVAELKQLGVTTFLAKPFSADRLHQALREVLGQES